MTDLTKIIFRPFAVLRTSAKPLAAQSQAVQANTQTKVCYIVAALPLLMILSTLNLIL